ncbi:MFS thioclapurine efflux transporter tcpA [Lachnellula suecica]|uniref:MFS thioclapurine efflux transporter tcpA n=1 Tax=Lachnellula suecica TaxID=602035 RepID=A0A8T9C390_9HELO|nr:MFS thioclapurine efflux transporter tcpA [Lachnellula suecica]
MALPESDNVGIVKPNAARLSLVIAGICLAVFLAGMDQTILATAIPVISVEFDTSADFGWWSNAYLLTLSAFQLFYGKLYSLFPIKHVYLIAIVIFEIGSLVCTTAPTSIALIIGRAIAGLGAARVFSGSVLILTKLIPLAQRAAYLGIMSAAFGLAAIVGPFLGAAILQSSTWRWCFGINLPLGAVTVVLCFFFVHTPVDPSVKSLSLVQKSLQLDIPGTIFMAGSLICLLMALQWGGATYPWSNGRIIALFVVSGVLACAFLATQMTSFVGKARTIPSSLARSRDVWLAGTYAICINGGVYVAVLFLPIWFQDVRGRSPLSSGEMLTPLVAGYVVASIVAGGITSGFKYYNPAMIIGTVLSVAGSALLTTINIRTSTARVVGYQLVFGFGIGFGFGQPSYVVQTLLPAADVPMGVTFITLVQNLSASIFVAVAQSIFQGEMHKRLEPLLPRSPQNSSLLLAALPKILSSMPAEAQATSKGAISDSIIRTFYVALGLSCASIIGALLVKWVPMRDPYKEQNSGSLQSPNTQTDEKLGKTAPNVPGNQTSDSDGVNVEK